MLERGGYAVIEAGSAAEALRQLRRRLPPVDLVLSDVVMPGGQGTELALAARELDSSVPVVLMSGYSDRHGQLEARILPKPFTEEALLARVHEELAARPGGAPVSTHPRPPPRSRVTSIQAVGDQLA
jgi:CheY-like chemotaxis protein